MDGPTHAVEQHPAHPPNTVARTIHFSKAVEEVVAFLGAEHGLSPDRALSPASTAVDFHAAEAVDLTQVVTGRIPKRLFGTGSP